MEEIRENFRFKKKFITEAGRFLESSIKTGTGALVGVHVRRGDMTEDYYIRYGYVTAPVEYYIRAMDRFRSEFAQVRFRRVQ